MHRPNKVTIVDGKKRIMHFENYGFVQGTTATKRPPITGICTLALVLSFIVVPTHGFHVGKNLVGLPSTLRINNSCATRLSCNSASMGHRFESVRKDKMLGMRGVVGVKPLASALAGEHELDETEEDSEDEFKSLKEDEEFIAAVEEVRDAAKNVTASTVNLTSKIVTKGPGIIGRLLGCQITKGLR